MPLNYSETLTKTCHIIQMTSWDCGLACVAMILVSLGIPNGRLTDLHSLVSTENIWTIELAYLLQRFNIADFTMYTSYIGINLQNNSKIFYKDSLSEDRERIHSLFAHARDKQVRVAPIVLDLDDARRFLSSSRYVIIMLVNLQLLNCMQCSKLKPRWWWSKDSPRNSISSQESGSNTAMTILSNNVNNTHLSASASKNYLKNKPFTGDFMKWRTCWPMTCIPCLNPYELLPEEFVGHYILLVGYEALTDVFYYRDPGVHVPLCAISGDQLEIVRSSSGTDHDAIVVKIIT